MLNSVAQQGQGRQPRGIVRLNGTAVDGWIDWTVTSNTFYEADTFRVSYAASALPTYADAGWFSRQTELFVEILAGFPRDPDHPDPAELGSLIYGRVDEIDFDPVSRYLTFSGRDLTAVFIDSRLDQDWANQTSSAIASALASKHGLLPVVTATTSGSVGGFYKRDTVRMHASQSEWDLLAFLAREEGFACYVVGQELHFEPDPGTSADPYVLRWQQPTNEYAAPVSNVQRLNFTRAMTVSKGVTVSVSSPSTTKKSSVVASYPSNPRAIQPGKSSPFGSVQTYYFTTGANRSAVQVQQEAQRRYAEIIAHEMKLTATLPGDNLLTTKTLLQVQGTGTAFDQTYFPVEITRQMSMDEGYTMTVRAKNQTPGQPS